MIGKMIRRLREGNKWKQAELAEKLGISRQALSNYERDAREVDAEMIVKLSNVFNVSADFILQIEQKQMTIEQIESLFEKDIDLDDAEFVQSNRVIIEGKILTAAEIKALRAFIRFHRNQ
jgi:transcriptional regulator with XRE-family HTH domain